MRARICEKTVQVVRRFLADLDECCIVPRMVTDQEANFDSEGEEEAAPPAEAEPEPAAEPEPESEADAEAAEPQPDKRERKRGWGDVLDEIEEEDESAEEDEPLVKLRKREERRAR